MFAKVLAVASVTKANKMIKSLISALIIACAITPVQADQVFQYREGVWSINGYYDFSNGQSSCRVGTEWGNGSRVSIIISPTGNGYNDVKMEVKSAGANWVDAGLKIGSKFDNQISFNYSDGQVKTLKALPIVEAIDTLVIEDLDADFDESFVGAKEMILFPGSPGELYVNLNGSTAMGVAMTNCLYEIDGIPQKAE